MNKGVHYRLINQNTLSALDEMLALTNFDDIINNDNINEATQLYLIELIMLLNYVVLFEQRPYLLKIQLKHGFQVRFVQISRNDKTNIHLLDKIKCPINSTHDLEILSQIKLGKQKYCILIANLNNLREIVKALGSK